MTTLTSFRTLTTDDHESLKWLVGELLESGMGRITIAAASPRRLTLHCYLGEQDAERFTRRVYSASHGGELLRELLNVSFYPDAGDCNSWVVRFAVEG